MKKYTAYIVLALFGLLIIQSLYVVSQTSPTFDEPNWMNIAWYLTHYWTWQGDYHVLMHPPLTFYLHGLPLRLLEWRQGPASKPPPEGELAKIFPYPYSAILRYDTVFTIAKLSMLPLALFAGWGMYAWASRLYGKPAGIFALILYVFNPYVVAYATMMTTDMAAACFMFFATYQFWRFCQQPSIQRSILAGLILGLALLSKATAVLLIPLFLLLGGGWLVATNSQNSWRTWPIKRIFLLIGLMICIAGIVVDAGFLFDRQPVRAFHDAQKTDLLYQVFKEIPIPFGAYLNSIRLHQSFILSMTRRQFLAGQVSTSPWWYYHVMTFLLKNPIPLILFILAGFWGVVKRGAGFWRREYFLIIPALCVFLYFSFWFPLNVSSRFVLPAYPFLFVLAGRVLSLEIVNKSSVRTIMGVLLFWYVLSAATIAPHYLAYCNELIGGTANGYRWFADSSYDWGQDLKSLGKFVQEHRIPAIKLAYFGKAIPEYYGIHSTPLTEPEGCQPTTGMIAISTTKLQGVYERDPGCFHWLQEYEPIEKIGYSLFIYSIK